MIPRPLLSLAVFILAFSSGDAVDIRNRSNTASGQFTIYCDDRTLRGELSDLVEETRTSVLKILNEPDAWKLPIIVTVTDDPAVEKSRVNLTSGYGATRIDVMISAGGKRIHENDRRQIISATLLELALRSTTAPKAGEPFNHPPWWLVEGIHEMILRPDGGTSVDVLKNILHTAKMPSLEKVLAGPKGEVLESLASVDRACAMCLVATLLAQENGSRSLLRFLTSWIHHAGDPLEKLTAEFPGLGESGKSLGKWWSLQLARFAAGDSIQSLSLTETDQELSKLLALDIVVDKKGRHESFSLADYETYLRFPAASVALKTGQVRLAALGAKAHPIFRPVLNGYGRVFGSLLARKTKHLPREIDEIENYRQTVLARMTDISDYLNWYEASQPIAQSAALDKYLKPSADARKALPVIKVDERVRAYLDTLEQDFSPRN